MNAEHKRGGLVALAGLGVHLVLAGLALVLWLASGPTRSPTAMATFWLLLGGLPVWLAAAILFYSRYQAAVEATEMAELAQQRGQTTIFGDQEAEMRLAERRLRRLERFFAPGITLLVALYHLGMGAWLFPRMLRADWATLNVGGQLTLAFFAVGGAFVGFLFSRYAIGMSKAPAWRLLRAGGSFLAVGVLGLFVLGAGLFALHVGFPWVHRVAAYAVPLAMFVLGVELALGFVMDFYRPRVAGVEQRFSFDSRLANLLSEPGSIAHSIAEALNYQFGFEVSSTWFYRLLQKAFIPLILFGLVAVVLISSIVIVGPGQEAVVLTWGKPPAPGLDGQRPTLGPGAHLKLPWPWQTADVVDVARMRAFQMGVAGSRGEAERATEIIRRPGRPDLKLYLWRQEHGERQERNLLVARAADLQQRTQQWVQQSRLSPGAAAAEAVAAAETQPAGADSGPAALREEVQSVGLARIVMDVQYRVRDVYAYRYHVADADTLLESIANRELLAYAATRDIDMLMASERQRLADELRSAIQARADEAGVGIEIVEVLPQGIHPPAAVADAFEGVVQADRLAEGEILRAQAQRVAQLVEVAGSQAMARAIAEAIEQRRQLQGRSAPPEQINAAEANLEDLLYQAGGQAKATLNAALAERWQMVNQSWALAEGFRKQLAAYMAAPELFMLQRELEVLAEGMGTAPKYVLGVDPDRVEVRIDAQHQRSLGSGLFGGTGD